MSGERRSAEEPRWTTPADVKAQLGRRWDRGDLLRSLVAGSELFPLRLTLKGPSSAELSDRFERVREWAVALAAMPRVRIEWREVRHRVQGAQRLPAEAWVDSLESAVALLGKRREVDRFVEMLELTRRTAPELIAWIARRPLQLVAFADRWPALLAVVGWRKDHPDRVLYPRQVDVAGVHTKFIEEHRAVLGELLEHALPASCVGGGERSTRHFYERFGFLQKPTQIRFRVLDERIELLPGVRCPDVTLDRDSFAALRLAAERVFITENETNFLAFPGLDNAIVIFGAGYGWERLGKARWLEHRALYYWGDIDTHGFVILDRLREHFPGVTSFLMDRETLDAHQAHWGRESEPTRQELPRLTPAEQALYRDLRDNRIRDDLRLEQERVGFGWLSAALSRL